MPPEEEREKTAAGNCFPRILLPAQLKNSCAPHSAANAHGHQAVTPVAPLELLEDGYGQFCAGGSKRMAQGNRAAVDIDAVTRQPDLANNRERLAGESFVEFDGIKVFDL